MTSPGRCSSRRGGRGSRRGFCAAGAGWSAFWPTMWTAVALAMWLKRLLPRLRTPVAAKVQCHPGQEDSHDKSTHSATRGDHPGAPGWPRCGLPRQPPTAGRSCRMARALAREYIPRAPIESSVRPSKNAGSCRRLSVPNRAAPLPPARHALWGRRHGPQSRSRTRTRRRSPWSACFRSSCS